MPIEFGSHRLIAAVIIHKNLGDKSDMNVHGPPYTKTAALDC